MKNEIKELLIEALTGESVARNKYTFFANKAREEGYVDIAMIYEQIANNELAHAKIWFKYLELLNESDVNINDAIHGENYEHTNMYPRLEEKAREYGDVTLANLFHLVAQIEASHEQRFKQIKDELQKNEVFHDPNGTTFECINCGYKTDSTDAPSICPVCKKPMSYFKKCEEN